MITSKVIIIKITLINLNTQGHLNANPKATQRMHKKVCKALNYLEHFFFCFYSAVNGCILIFEFGSLVGISEGVGSSTVGLQTCAITARI